MERLLLTKGAILGVDFGDKRTGLATCDPSRLIATAIGVISPGGIEKTAEAVAEEAEKRGVSAIVVGLPVNMDGSEGGRAARYRKFARLLEERLDGKNITALKATPLSANSAYKYATAEP